MNRESSLKRPALYNPALWSRDEVRTYYVARPKILARFLDDFRREQPGTRPQHRLILGQRGMGKSTLLRRLAIGVEDDVELAAQWLPLNFPEEQYNVATLADFWLNCLDALGDWLEARGDIAEMQALDAEIERLDRKDGEGALQTLLRLAGKLQRRLLLLVDNIDLILERLKDKDWALREALQEHPELLLVGASSRALEATYDYGAAFYDFFRIDELRGLSEDEMQETIVNLARLRGADELIRRLDDDPGRLRVLHTLTGGNPRTAVLLYGVLLKGIDGDVRSDLEGLLDEVTPLYKARFDELPAQAQQLLDKLALHWDPMSARQAADALGWQVNQASAQLDRLVQAGVVEKVKSGRNKRMAFQVAERFFNIWYLMRASRRVRRKLMWLVEFLRAAFSRDELQQWAARRLYDGCENSAEAEYHLAICRAIGPLPIALALETQALHSLLARGGSQLEELFDLYGEDHDLAPKAERIRALQGVRQRLSSVLGDKASKELLDIVCGFPVASQQLLQLIQHAEKAGDAGKEEIIRFANEMSDEQTRWLGDKAGAAFRLAIAGGDMANIKDLDGGAAAALRYGIPVLAILPQLYLALSDQSDASALEKYARQALAEDSSGTAFWYALALSLRLQGRDDESLTAAREVLARDQKTPDVLAILGDVLLGGGKGKVEAVKVFRSLSALRPDDLIVKKKLCSVLLSDAGQLEEARRLARELCVAEPEDQMNWLFLAVALFGDADHFPEQLAAVRRALSLQAEPDHLRWLLANSLLVQEKYSEARQETVLWLAALANEEQLSPEDYRHLKMLLHGAVVKGEANAYLDLLDTSGAGDKLRPAREALAVVAAGTTDYLDGIAPEIRVPALDVLAVIAPQMCGVEPQPGSV